VITSKLAALALDLRAWYNAAGPDAVIEAAIEAAADGECSEREIKAIARCAKNHLRGRSAHNLADRQSTAVKAATWASQAAVAGSAVAVDWYSIGV
jgi:hypothetical protein